MVNLKIKFLNSTTQSPATVNLEIPNDARVFYLKERIQTAFPGCQVSRQILRYEGNNLEDSRTIGSYGFENDDGVDLYLAEIAPRPASEIFRVQILGKNGIDDFILEVQGTMTVSHLKFLIGQAWGGMTVSRNSMIVYHTNNSRNILELMHDDYNLHHYAMDRNSAVEVWLADD